MRHDFADISPTDVFYVTPTTGLDRACDEVQTEKRMKEEE